MAGEIDPIAPAGRSVGLARLAIGLTQGLALLAFHRAYDFKSWPATQGPLFGGMLLAVAFAPLIPLAGYGHLRRATQITWTLVAVAVCVALGAYEVYGAAPGSSRITPEFPVWAATAAGLFIAHHLIVPADAARRWIAPYPAYFDAAWLNAAQLGLAIAFTGAFWLLLELGAALFGLIGVKGFGDLIHKDWFYFPAVTVAFSAAVHLADVRVKLTRGLRGVGLILLSWLLPMMGAIAVTFLAALPFTGLAPLWKAGAATGVLLGSIGALIVLINAAYQDGAQEAPAPFVLRWAARITALTLVPLAAIAVWGLCLRIGQHGLTPQRIMAAAVAGVSVCYALGYAWSAIRLGRWMRRLEATNIACALIILATILALFTPIADPTRIAVTDQVARLESGRTKPTDFDFDFLRRHAGRDGAEALARLTRSTNTEIAGLAIKTRDERDEPRFGRSQPGMARPLADRITVYPRGATLPAGFLTQDWRSRGGSPCWEASCEAYLADLKGDGAREVVVHQSYGFVVWARQADDDAWSIVGNLEAGNCPAVIAALRAGAFQAIVPQWSDLQAAGQRLRFIPMNQSGSDCQAPGGAPNHRPSGARLRLPPGGVGISKAAR